MKLDSPFKEGYLTAVVETNSFEGAGE
jgi:hypothetical protein